MKCPECHNDKVLLATGHVFEFYPDSEPFESGEELDLDPFEDEVMVGIHYCLDCRQIVDAWIEDPRCDLWTSTAVLPVPEENGGWLLIHIDFHEPHARPAIRLGCYDHHSGYWRTQFGRLKAHWEVTHWMPLPDSPILRRVEDRS